MKKLFLYGVLVNIDGKNYVKFGQTSQFSQEEAIKYALNKTLGKLKGVGSKENVIFCIDVTEKVKKDIINGLFTAKEPDYDKYDDFVRDSFVKKHHLHMGIHSYATRNNIGGGSRELHEYESNFTKKEIFEEWQRLMNDFMVGSSNLLTYPTRETQKTIIKQTVDYILNLHKQGILNLSRKTRRFLINSKMRSGKNHITYQVAKQVGYQKILILTYKPSGVDEGWKEDLDHIEFGKTKFSFAKEMDNVEFDDNFDGIQVIFGSFQDAIGENGNKDKWLKLKNQQIDLVVIDEMHYGSETKKALSFLDTIMYKFLINLSGTPLKALRRGSFKKEQIAHFTYMDEQRAKNNWDYNQGENPYQWMPNLSLLLMKYDNDFKKEFYKEYTKEEEPTMEKVFAKKQLRDLFLNKLWSKNNVFLNYNINHGFWLLPSVKACNLVEQSLIKNPNYQEFEIINVAGDGENQINEVKNKIKKSIKSITLSCKRFDTGTTVQEWDYVMMLNNIKSAESYWQTAFRPGTPWKEGNKQEMYVFDWDYNRVLQVVGDYSKSLEEYSNKSMFEIVKEMLDTMPIHSLGNAVPTKITVEEILNHYHQDRSTSFDSTYLFDNEKLDENICNILQNRDEIKTFFVENKLDLDSESNGKTYHQYVTNLVEKKETQTIQKINDWVAKARSITILIPHIIQQEENIKTLSDFDNHSKLFFNITGMKLENFKVLIDVGFIDGDLLDDTIQNVNYQMYCM